jgi:catechol 2,3-dioxygenase-like lactoylglutathione lyase family enzyme
MATLGLNHFNLRAHPELLEKLRDFYRDVVGLEVGFRPPFQSAGYWLYAGDQAVLHLSASAAGAAATSAAGAAATSSAGAAATSAAGAAATSAAGAAATEMRPVDATTTFDHVAFSCTDLPAFEERLARHGIKYRTGRVPQTSQVQLFVRDPAGNGVELNFA